MSMTSAGVRYVAPGEGEQWWVVGDTYTFKATSRDTGGALALIEAHVPVDAGPPPHVHGKEDEFFYILEGELEIRTGELTTVAGPGAFVFIPRGTEHAFCNRGSGPARTLFGFTPAGFEEFFAEVGLPAVAGEAAPPLGPEEMAHMLDLAPRFGLEVRLPG